MLAEDASRGAEHLELGLQPLGRREVAAIIPERRVVALGGVIMEHEEIADIDLFAQRTRVVAGDRERIEIGRASCRERVCQYVAISVVAVSLNKKNKAITTNEI